MERIRELPPWQIILGAVGALLIALIGGFFVVTVLTTSKPPTGQTSTIPQLNSPENAKIVKSLEAFEAPNSLPIVTEPLRTADPNSPSTVNPFRK
jgi:hypothetical protein